MRKRIEELKIVVALLIFVLTCSGCLAVLVAGALAGAGGYAWVNGIAVKELNASVERVHRAAVNSLRQMDCYVEEDKTDHLKSVIVAKTSTVKEVRVEIDALTEKRSKVNIRYGMFGDREKSEMILNAIQKNL